MSSINRYPIFYQPIDIHRVNAHDDDSCCFIRLSNRVVEAVVSFFTVIAQALWAATTWILEAIFCCESEDDYPANGVGRTVYDFNNPDHNPYAAANVAALANGVLDVKAQPAGIPRQNLFGLNPAEAKRTSGAREIQFDALGWEVPPEDLNDLDRMLLPHPAALFSPHISTASTAEAGEISAPKVENVEELRQKSLARLQEIQASIDSGNLLHFEIIPEIMHFDLDAMLVPFSKNTPVIALMDMLEFVERKARQDELEWRPLSNDQRRINQHHLSLANKKALLREKLGPYQVERDRICEIARETLSQIYNILDAKRKKIEQHPFKDLEAKIAAENELKDEIIKHFTAIIDAHTNCVDQVNAQLHNVLLDVVASELKKNGGKSASVVAASLTLFRYRANLITEATQRLYPQEQHMADLERMAMAEIGPKVGLNGKAAVQGALFQRQVPNAVVQIRQISQEFLRKFNSQEGIQKFFLLRELKACHGAVSTRILRGAMIKDVMDKLDIDNAYDEDYQFSDPTVKQICEMASKPGEDVFQLAAEATDAGIVWLMEEAGIIHELPRPS